MTVFVPSDHLGTLLSLHYAFLCPSLVISHSGFARALIPSNGTGPWSWITSGFSVRRRSCPCRCPQALQGNTLLLFLSTHIHVHSDSGHVRTIRFAASSCDVLLRLQPEQAPPLRWLRQELLCRELLLDQLTALILSRTTTTFLPGDPPATKPAEQSIPRYNNAIPPVQRPIAAMSNSQTTCRHMPPPQSPRPVPASLFRSQ